MTRSNPEIRFRVPPHIHQLAKDRAAELGLSSRRGKTGGASELARGALYAFLDLGLPGELAALSEEGFQRARVSAREQGESPQIVVTVHHRVQDEYRKNRSLKDGQSVPSRRTTEFRFPQGELPEFLVPFITLTAGGTPYSTLNLEGALSPRQHVLGELHSSTESLTLEELQAYLRLRRQKKERKEKERLLRQERLERGTEILRKWSQQQGSELLKARLEGHFEWLELASLEYAEASLEKLGVKELEKFSLTHSLASDENSYRNIRSQNKPQLQTMTKLKSLRTLEDSGLSVQPVLVEDADENTLEGVLLSFQLPIPSKQQFLTSLIPALPE